VDGIVTLPGILYLSFNTADPTATWTFTFDGAFITAAASSIVFVDSADASKTIVYGRPAKNGKPAYEALAARVTWDVKGAITLGASSKVGGTMQSEETITLGASAQCGRLEADAAIVLGASADSGPLISGAAITVGAGASCGPIRAGAAITVGAGSTISVLRPGGGAAVTVGAGVVCEFDSPNANAVWSVTTPCYCDPSYTPPTPPSHVLASTVALRGDDCAT
jgi:hypothetical protein